MWEAASLAPQTSEKSAQHDLSSWPFLPWYFVTGATVAAAATGVCRLGVRGSSTSSTSSTSEAAVAAAVNGGAQHRTTAREQTLDGVPTDRFQQLLILEHLLLQYANNNELNDGGRLLLIPLLVLWVVIC